jgi:hypothetical protein
MSDDNNNEKKPVIILPDKIQRRPSNRERLAQYQKRFPKGKSGNPAGRPKYKRVSEDSREYLDEIDPATGLTNSKAIVAAIGERAKKGDTNAARELRSWAEGTSSSSLEINNNTVNITDAKEKLFSKLIRLPDKGENNNE